MKQRAARKKIFATYRLKTRKDRRLLRHLINILETFQVNSKTHKSFSPRAIAWEMAQRWEKNPALYGEEVLIDALEEAVLRHCRTVAAQGEP